MRAWQVTQKGFKNLTLLKDSPIPSPNNPHDILIKNIAVGLNPADYKRCDRDQPPFIPTPFIIGGEGCGVIEKAGPGVDSAIYAPGKLVYYKSNSFGVGCFSDYTIQDARTISFVPEKLLQDDNVKEIAVKFASLPVCAWTAYTNVCVKLRLGIFPVNKEMQSNPKIYKNIVVNGASGGVGSFVLQLLDLWRKNLDDEELKKNVRIIGVCSGKNGEYVKSLGATHVVDYKEEGYVGKINLFPVARLEMELGIGQTAVEEYFCLVKEICEEEGVDAFFDNVGGKTIDWVFEVLGNGGDYLTNLTVPKEFDMSKLFFKSQNIHQTYLSNMYMNMVDHQLKELKEIGDIVGRLIEEGKVKARDVKVIGFEEIKENLEEIGVSGSKGKIVALLQMQTTDSAVTHMGKLTSLNPNLRSISLSKNPSTLIVSLGLVEADMTENSSSELNFEIHQDQEDFFVCYAGSNLSVYIEDQILKENQAVKINSGQKVVLSLKDQNDIRMEYIFSSELTQIQKSVHKSEQEKDEKLRMIEKQAKFYENMDNETKCGICKKMIYECASVVPCLHKFCIECLLFHLTGSQTCPQCGWRCEEFRKDIFFNNIIEAYEENGLRRDRSEVENREMRKRFERERIFAGFEYSNGEVYEGEWKKFRKDGRGRMIFKNGDTYEGDWRNGVREGKGELRDYNEDLYEGDWKNNQREGEGKIIFKNGAVYEGDWKNNKREGKGKLIDLNGEVYEGDWRNNQREGKGKVIFKNGETCEGEWRNNQREGKGKMRDKFGNVYEGEWKMNLLEGQVKIKYNDRNVYKGYWKNNQRQGKGKMKYSNGDFYEGDWINDKMEGKGKMGYENGDFYEGDWRNNMRDNQGEVREEYWNGTAIVGTGITRDDDFNGDIYEDNWESNVIQKKGKMKYSNGNIYEGDWKNDLMEGKGKYIWSDGHIYEGDWKNNLMEGIGKVIFKDGDSYEGGWKNQLMEGKGKRIYKDGDVYEDNWKKNQKEGKGKMIYNDGTIYEGDWKNNMMEGKGKKICKNGLIYEGDWKKGRFEGKGKAIYNDGNIYEGDWKNSKIEGKGKARYYNGDTYEGDWKNDKKEGQGKMIYNDGAVYEGDWKSDMREGQGKMIYNNGDVYEGDWKTHMREGQGKMIYKDGIIYGGDWRNSTIEGKGKAIFKNGDTYEGDWKNNVMEGKGKMIYNNGPIYEGDWKNGRFGEAGEMIWMKKVAK